MPEDICAANIGRYQVGHWSDDDSPFCLAQLNVHETEDEAQSEKVDRLLNGRYDPDAPDFTQACNVGKCTLRIIRNESVGKRIEGSCRAASFCLKQSFESVPKLPKDEGKSVYKDIIDSLEGHMDKYNAGNFCPKLDCGLSAGVSIDGHAGTAGECRDELLRVEPLPFED